MYSIFFSRIEIGMDLVKDRLKKEIKKNSRVAIFPQTFPFELDVNKLENEFFKKSEKRYNRKTKKQNYLVMLLSLIITINKNIYLTY